MCENQKRESEIELKIWIKDLKIFYLFYLETPRDNIYWEVEQTLHLSGMQQLKQKLMGTGNK